MWITFKKNYLHQTSINLSAFSVKGRSEITYLSLILYSNAVFLQTELLLVIWEFCAMHNFPTLQDTQPR